MDGTDGVSDYTICFLEQLKNVRQLADSGRRPNVRKWKPCFVERGQSPLFNILTN
jgi:hypothetical protein